MTGQPPIYPDQAANLMHILLEDREEGTLIWLIRAFSMVGQMPKFERHSKEQDSWSIERHCKEGVRDELAIADFLIRWGESLKAWCEDEGPARAKALEKEKERKKAARIKEKEKRAKQTKGRAAQPEPDEDDEDEDEGTEDFCEGLD